jgi:mono/diheme cytochrome c family protein
MPSVHNGTEFAQTRARAYLDANCSQCHNPQGSARGDWDGHFSTPLAMQKLIGVAPIEALGVQGAKLLAPQSPATSIVLKRMSATDGTAMPPLARNIVDADAVSLFNAWIAGMNTQAKSGTPVATKNLGLSTKANAPLTLSLAGTDPDGDALDYRISQMPTHGTLEGFGKDLVYTPHADFTGVDAFTFAVTDGNNASQPATVQIAVQ